MSDKAGLTGIANNFKRNSHRLELADKRQFFQAPILFATDIHTYG